MPKTLAFARFFLSLCLFLWLVLFAGQLRADTTKQLNLGEDLPWLVFEDPDNKLTINEVSRRNDFQALPHKLIAGHSKSAFWLRFKIPASGDWLLEAGLQHLDNVTVFIRQQQHWQDATQGDIHPFNERPIQYRHFLFNLENTSAGQIVFIKIHTAGSVNFEATLWRHIAFIEESNKKSLLAGIYFALYLPIIFMALVYGVSLRQPVFIAFAVTSIMALLLMATISGFAVQFLWFNTPQIAHFSLGILLCSVISCSTILGGSVIETHRYWPRLDLYLKRICLLILLAGLTVFTDYYSPIISGVFLTHVAIRFLFACLSFIQLWRRQRNAFYLLAIFSLEACSGLMFVLENLGFLNQPWINMYIWHTNALFYMFIGYGILVQRLRHAETEKNRIQAAALLQSQQSEELLKKGIAERTGELEQVRESLETTLASERQMRLDQRQFIAMITHEIRNPLAVIDSAAFNLEKLFKNVPERYLRQIRQAVKRIVCLVDNCLAEDRLSNPEFKPQIARISPKQIIDEAVEIVSGSAKHQLIKQLDALPKFIEADPTLLRIALSNLLDSVVKYAAPGIVAITGEVTGTLLVFSICDNGSGSDENLLATIFNRHDQGSNKRSSVELGLFLTQSIARLHGGDLSVSRSPEGGSCFQLSIRCDNN